MSSTMPPVYRMPGAEMVERRLARAAALPPNQRTPETEAFVRGASLLAAAREALPLSKVGASQYVAALGCGRPEGATRAELRQVLLAFARAAAADCLGPGVPPQKPEAWPYLQSYLHFLPACAREGGALAGVLQLYTTATAVTRFDTADRLTWNLRRLHECSCLSQRLSAPAARLEVDCQLAALTDQAGGGGKGGSRVFTAGSGGGEGSGSEVLVTAAQLQQSLCIRVSALSSTLRLEMHAASTLPAGDLLELHTAETSCTDVLLQHWPDCPKAIAAAALMWSSAQHGGSGGQGRCQQVHDLYRRGLELAQASGSDFHTAYITYTWIAFAANSPLSGDAASLEAALAAHPAAEVALKRVKKVLPDIWVQQLVDVAALAQRQLLPGLQSQLRCLAGGRSTTASQRAALLDSMHQATDAAGQGLGGLASVHAKYSCAACNQYSVALRKCSRCKGVEYCSRDCQLAHWKAHKPACVPV